MKKTISFLSLIFAISFQLHSQPYAPCNPNATATTNQVLSFIYSIEGEKMLSGQMGEKWNVNNTFDIVFEKTNKYPAIYGIDFLFGNDNRQSATTECINKWKAGSLIQCSWHAVQPWKPDNESTGWNDMHAGMAAPADIDLMLTPGTTYNLEWMRRLDNIAGYLKQMQNEGVTVLWRPFHEMNYGWFWWGRSTRYKELWIQMYNRFVGYHGLNNLIWVFCPNYDYNPANATKWEDMYPGDQYVDVLALDIYINYSHTWSKSQFDRLKTTGKGRPVAVGENGDMPNPQTLFSQDQNWVWWMTWCGFETQYANTNEYYTTIYAQPQTVTQGQIVLGDIQAPTIPTNLASSITAQTSFTLTWTASTDNVGVTGYEVFAGGVSKGTTATTSLNITGLACNNTYSMTVKARDAAGNWSTASTPLSVTTSACTSTVYQAESYTSQSGNAVSSSFANYTGTGYVDFGNYSGTWLEWNNVSISTGGIKNLIFRYANGSTVNRTCNIIVNGTTVGTVNFVPYTTDWSNWMTASIAANLNAGNNTIRVTSTTAAGGPNLDKMDIESDSQAPTTPTNLASSSITTTSFTLTWTASTDNFGVTGYEVFAGGVSKGTTVTTSLNITGLACNNTYSMTVKARDAAGNWSTASTPLSVTNSACPITAYQAESYTSQAGNAVSTNFANYTGTGFVDFGNNSGTWLEWNSVNISIAGNNNLIFRYANGSAVNRTCNIIVNGTSVGTVNFTPYTTDWNNWTTASISANLISGNNTIRVTSTATAGGPNLDKMDIQQIGGFMSPRVTTDIENITIQKSRIEVFPTSTVDKINIRLINIENDCQIKIFNIYGKLIYSKKYASENNEISISSHESSGLYIISVEDKNGLYNSKFIKR